MIRILVLVTFCLSTSALHGQGQEPSPTTPPESVRGPHWSLPAGLFQPHLLERYGGEIALDDVQKRVIAESRAEFERSAAAIYQTMSPLSEELLDLLDSDVVDEDAALALLDRLLELDARIKKENIRYLIRVKDALRPDQQARLRQIRQTLWVPKGSSLSATARQDSQP